ncbi:MAG: YbdK family carboxylate-amine ligase [Nitrospiraceae bacterium]|nr:MAG: YbdK family carboxylate-amine ligase [Nitrospiraceae bacterium]
MEELVFNSSSAPTIGVEVEIQILNAETLRLTPLAPDILKMVHPSFREKIKPEFIQSMIEVNTKICSSVKEVEKDLKNTFSHLREITEGLGATLYFTSLHPFSIGSQQEVSDHPRYRRIMNELQLIGRRFITQGLHVHIGVDDREKVIKINNIMRIYLPILLALSTSSPFYESLDTGLMSYRAKLFESLPLAGMPDSLDGWESFTTLTDLLKKNGIIESVKDIWWDVRPHPDFGTVEIRMCDLPYSFRDILAITAFIQALVLTISEQYETPNPHIQVLRSNKWQAARHGLDGFYVDPIFGKKHSMQEAVRNIYRFVKPVAESLRSIEYLDEVPEILKRGSGSHLQRKIYSANGRSFEKMIKMIQELFYS